MNTPFSSTNRPHSHRSLRPLQLLAALLCTLHPCLAEGLKSVQRTNHPAASVALAPAFILASAVSANGHHVLATTASDSFAGGQSSGIPQVLLLDTTNLTQTLVSTGPNHEPANGASLHARFTANPHQIIFQSRASNLVPNDTNSDWDIFLCDLDAGTTTLLSVSTNGTAASGASCNPRLTERSQWLLFDSTATDLTVVDSNCTVAPYTKPWTYAVNLETGVLTRLASGDTNVLSLAHAQVASQPPIAIGVAKRQLPAGTYARSIFIEDLAAQTNHLINVNNSPEFGAPALSADGSRAAWCSIARISLRASNTVFYLDTTTGNQLAVASSLITNSQRFDALLTPALSSNGQWLAFPLPSQPAGSTNVTLQLHLWDALTQTTTLVSANPTTGTEASGHSHSPIIAPDGSWIVFTSEATNLLTEPLTPGTRTYLCQRNSGTVTLLTDASNSPTGTEVAVHSTGARAASATLAPDSAITLHLTDLLTGTPSEAVFPSANLTATTHRSWTLASPQSATPDGRLLTVVAPPDAITPAQVYLVDAVLGERTLISHTSDNLPSSRGCYDPQISASGDRIAFTSTSTNLLPAKTGKWVDVLVYSRSGSTFLESSIAWRQTLTTDVTPNFALSPDGQWLALETTDRRVLVNLDTGNTQLLPLRALARPPQFSANSTRLALETPWSGSPRTLAVFDLAHLAAGNTNTLWNLQTSSSGESALSPDGSRLAYTGTAPASSRWRLTIVDLSTGTAVFTHDSRPSVSLSAPVLSLNGAAAAWVEHSVPSQIWHANLNSGVVQLISTARDGTTPGNGNSRYPALDITGRWIAFASTANNLAGTDLNGAKDVFLRDTQFNQTYLVSQSTHGRAAGGWSTRPWFSPDGTSLFFSSSAPDLAPGDFNTSPDLFQIAVLDAGIVTLLVQPVPGTSQATLQWTGKSGVPYQLQFTDDISLDWQPYQGPANPDGSVTLDTSIGQRFYRVIGP